VKRKKPDGRSGVGEDGGAEGDKESGKGPSCGAEDKDGRFGCPRWSTFLSFVADGVHFSDCFCWILCESIHQSPCVRDLILTCLFVFSVVAFNI